MSTVAILGAGDLGGAVAQALAASDHVSRIVIVDAAAGVAAGKALDIQQSGAVDGVHTRLSGTDDLSRAAGCAVCVVADRYGARGGEWQGEDGLALLSQLRPFVPAAPLVFAGTLQAELMLAAAREGGYDRRRLIGSAVEAFASAVTAIVAMEARCSPSEVSLAVLGAPPHGLIVPWSGASIGGYALERVLEQVQLTRVEARSASLWPPAPYALGMAAAVMIGAILRSSRRSCAALTVLDGEFGARNRIGVLPALLSTSGIVHTRLPPLSQRERVRLETALGV